MFHYVNVNVTLVKTKIEISIVDMVGVAVASDFAEMSSMSGCNSFELFF